jgi:hypothetical protein
MEPDLSWKQIGQVATGHRPVLAAVLNQETSQSRLNQPVLIPVGVVINEGAHRFQERLWHLRHQAHRSFDVSFNAFGPEASTRTEMTTLPTASDHQRCSPMPHHFSTAWSQSQM